MEPIDFQAEFLELGGEESMIHSIYRIGQQISSALMDQHSDSYQYLLMTDVLKDSTDSLLRGLLTKQKVLDLGQWTRLSCVHKVVP